MDLSTHYFSHKELVPLKLIILIDMDMILRFPPFPSQLQMKLSQLYQVVRCDSFYVHINSCIKLTCNFKMLSMKERKNFLLSYYPVLLVSDRAAQRQHGHTLGMLGVSLLQMLVCCTLCFGHVSSYQKSANTNNNDLHPII